MPLPNGYLTEIVLFLGAGALFAFPMLLLNLRLAPRLGLIDWPKARGITEDQIPIVGHSLVIITLIASAILIRVSNISPWFLTTATIMAVMGHLDDRRPLPPLDKLLFQGLCAAAVVFLDPLIHEAITAKYGVMGTALGIFFLVGLINAVNFIDGIDGLAGIVLFVGATGYLLLSCKTTPTYGYTPVAALMMGMLLPFLYVNVVRRKGFLGNVGSYFFSYVLGMMHLSIPLDAADIVPRLSLSALCFLIPIADACMVIVLRVGTGRSPFHPDRGHLHHRLVTTSLNLRYILLIFLILESSALALGFVMSLHPGIRHSFLPAIVCMSQVFSTAVLIVLVEKASRRRIQTYFERLDVGKPIFFLKYHLRNSDGTPLTRRKLSRLESRVGSEIRISDLCFCEEPDVLFITLKVISEPFKGICGRIETLLHNEKVEIVGTPEQGEYIKATQADVVPLKRVK